MATSPVSRRLLARTFRHLPLTIHDHEGRVVCGRFAGGTLCWLDPEHHAYISRPLPSPSCVCVLWLEQRSTDPSHLYYLSLASMTLLSRIQHPLHGASSPPASDTDTDGEHHPEKTHPGYDSSPVPRITWASVTMGVLVSMGGFIFGYDTGTLDVTCNEAGS